MILKFYIGNALATLVHMEGVILPNVYLDGDFYVVFITPLILFIYLFMLEIL